MFANNKPNGELGVTRLQRFSKRFLQRESETLNSVAIERNKVIDQIVADRSVSNSVCKRDIGEK